jgi:hypothetical protein
MILAALLGRLGLGLGAAATRTRDASEGVTTALEQAMVDEIKTLNLFKTVDRWKHQISADQGGAEAFDKYAPFAFVKFAPPTDSNRQGDGDLNQILRFEVGTGFKSKEAGQAKDAASQARDLIINLFDRWHPGSGFECDDFHFDTDEVNFDSSTRHGLILFFKTSLITD